MSAHSGPKGIDWEAQPLGQMTDRELARQIGCTHTAVRVQRVKRGIPPSGTQGRPKPIDWSSLPLGQKPDSVIARQIGVRTQVVAHNRIRLGIELSAAAREASARLRSINQVKTFRRRRAARKGVPVDPLPPYAWPEDQELG